jgi:hypothetical protein
MEGDAVPSTADELEAIRVLKARYCRYLDTRDVDGWRSLFAPDLTVLLDAAVSTGGADGQTGPPIEGVDSFVPMVLSSLDGVATVHHCHTPELTLTSATTATGIWAMEDLLFFPDGNRLHGAGHYHETYAKSDGAWLITSLHLTRTLLRFSAD